MGWPGRRIKAAQPPDQLPQLQQRGRAINQLLVVRWQVAASPSPASRASHSGSGVRWCSHSRWPGTAPIGNSPAVAPWRLREPAVLGAGPAGIAVVSRIDRDQRHPLLLVDPAARRGRVAAGLPGPLDLDMNPAVDRLGLVTAGEVVLATRGPRGQAPIMLAAYHALDGRVAWRVPVQADQWPTWTPDGRLLIVGSPPHSTTPGQSLTAVDLHSGRLLWRSVLPMIADRPAAPLRAGAVIQVWDPHRGCATVGTASVGVGDRGGRSVGVP
jgi:hypothetical protein